ncbi:uncharacterized protein (TIGR01244 family) [Paucimonas lemoignei]|uniref:Uncharacterized protein (TIGR01244 family) n=1 Tax=Paucimonas lemoignei TaxID=29443 RepID=A0A4R3HPN2_PAULE|nr:sulfur transferase domain-containing protein [Paucimonas lemoignei]TCS33074.1 uncharacterized protein (TIGR01244 family) [Paucimonas lemoignei]
MERFKQIGEDVFIGPQPTAADLKEAKQRGIATVIDFRMPAETSASNEELAKSCGLDYANIPVNKESLSKEQISQLDEVMQHKRGPFLLHCGIGTRAATLYALKLASQHHWNAEQTFEAANSMGFDLQSSPQFAEFVARATENHTPAK